MPARKILVLDGHPDVDSRRFGHAMAAEYVQGARDGGHDAKLVRAADLDLPLLRSQSLFAMPPEEEAIGALQRDLKWADHLVIGFPLWLGAPPAVLKGLLEQIARGSFIAEVDRRGWRPQLVGRSARILVTMGAPSLYYRFVQGGHGVAAWRRGGVAAWRRGEKTCCASAALRPCARPISARWAP